MVVAYIRLGFKKVIVNRFENLVGEMRDALLRVGKNSMESFCGKFWRVGDWRFVGQGMDKESMAALHKAQGGLMYALPIR
jgi:hypothetical protein